MTNETDPPIVLGSELATAHERERKRQDAHPGPSLLDDLGYTHRSARIDAPSFAVDPLDETLRDLANEWLRLPADALGELLDQLSLDDLYTLLTFARRSTVLGLQSRDPQWPRAALAALTLITPDRVDYRDLTWAAGLVAYTLNQLTPSASDEIRRAATRTDASAKAILKRFANDPPQTLSDWGYAVIDRGDNLSVVSSEYRPWNPTVDLARVAQLIAVAIDAEGSYAATSITVATRLPPFWLKGSPEEAHALQAVDQAPATVSVRAQPVTTDRPNDHMLTAFIPELPNPPAADLVARSSTAATGTFARLALTNGAVAVVLIARSVVPGVPSLEDNATLHRFHGPFAEALARLPPHP
jgi:hypothetical protein